MVSKIQKSKVKMTRQKLKPLLFGVVIVLTLLITLFIPVFGYADEGHVDAVPHSEVPVLPIESDDDFVGDRHTEHIHEITIVSPWYQNLKWWVLFIISLFMMSLLSFGVYKYLQVKVKQNE